MFRVNRTRIAPSGSSGFLLAGGSDMAHPLPHHRGFPDVPPGLPSRLGRGPACFHPGSLAATLSIADTMHYADEVRRYNLLSGLALGALVGAGLALIALPGGTRTTSKKVRRATARVERGARNVERQAVRGARRVRRRAGDALAPKESHQRRARKNRAD